MSDDVYDHRHDSYDHIRTAAGRPVVQISGEIPQAKPLDSQSSEVEDVVGKPKHYRTQVPGVEAWDILKHFNYLRGNSMKYLWRAGDKGDIIQDLRKAIAYIEKEIELIEERRHAQDRQANH